MGWRDWLPWKRASAPAFHFTPMGSENFGPGIGNQPTAETLLRESAGPFDSGTKAIANRVSELHLCVKVVRRTADGTTEDEILDDHPLQTLLDKPHPDVPKSMLLFNAAQHIVASGQCYFQKVGNGFGVPVQLHPMPPGRIDPLVNRGVLVGYLVTDAYGRQERIAPDLVVRAWFPDPENFWGAEGYLSPTGLAHDAHKFAMMHLRYHYQHDATPKGVIEAGELSQSFTDDQKRKFWQQWEERYDSMRGTVRGPAILPTGFTYKPVTLDARERLAPLLEYFRDDQLMALKVPRAVLGQVVSGDRSSAEVMQWAFDRYAVTPITNLISAALTLKLAPDFDQSLIVEFEPFVSEDKEFELAREAHDLEHALRTPNKVLTDRGDDEVEWGDTPLMAGTIGPYDPERALQAMDSATAAVDAGTQATLNPPQSEPSEEDDEKAERREHAAIRAKYARKKAARKKAA